MIITKHPSELTAEELSAMKITHLCASEALDKLVETWAGHMKNGLAGEQAEVVAAMLGGYLDSRMASQIGRTVGITILAAAVLRLAQLKANPQTLGFSA